MKQAIETFGGLDVLVNNAGILRDRMLVNMSEAEWDAVINVHLKGTFGPTRHAAAYWRERAKAGETNDARVINTTSVSGIYGNAGQTNYGAAKMGIAAFTIIAALELERYGVTVNAIAPGALTRMTEGLDASRAHRGAEGGAVAAVDRADRHVAGEPRVVRRDGPGLRGLRARAGDCRGLAPRADVEADRRPDGDRSGREGPAREGEAAGRHGWAGPRRLVALAYDDVGDPDGYPLLYFHGFADSRRSRHPDDGIAKALSIRLVAVDRPGFGDSEPDGGADYRRGSDDVLALADELGVEQFSVMGWSSGAPLALACGAVAPRRVWRVGVLAGVPPIEADADVAHAMDELYATRSQLVDELGPRPFAEIVAPLAAVPGMDDATARDYVLEGRDDATLADLHAVPGLVDQLALGCATSTARGLEGAIDDLCRQVSPWGFDLPAVTTHVVLWYGTNDHMFKPAVGEWLAARLPDATIETVAGGSHLFPFVRWSEILSRMIEPRSYVYATEP